MHFFIIFCEFFVFSLGAINFAVHQNQSGNDVTSLEVKLDGSLDVPVEPNRYKKTTTTEPLIRGTNKLQAPPMRAFDNSLKNVNEDDDQNNDSTVEKTDTDDSKSDTKIFNDSNISSNMKDDEDDKNSESNESKTDTVSQISITKINSPPTMRISIDNMLENVSWHKVKDDDRIRDFTVHVYKQSMKVFDAIKKKVSRPDIKEKVDTLARRYRDKFTDFVQETREVEIRTRNGEQKVILHTIDTSNLILQRLVNFLKVEMAKLGIFDIGENNLQKEVDIERDLENRHVCVKLGFCRSSQGFRNTLEKVIKLLLEVPDAKLRQATDAVTEMMKSSDYTGLPGGTAKIKKFANLLETIDLNVVRQVMKVVLGVLTKSESPIAVSDVSSPVVAKTAAFYEILEAVDRVLPADEANKLEWQDTLNMLNEWKNEKRKDILEIMQTLDANVRRGVNKMDKITQEKVIAQIKIMAD